MSGIHAPISPSSLALTVACQAWIKLAEGLPPEPEGEEAQEGTAADWVARQYLRGNEVAYGTPIPTPGNFKVDYDMIRGAKMWCDVMGYGGQEGTWLPCPRIHPSACAGTPDGWRYDPIAQRIIMPEYKYGFGVVEVMWVTAEGQILVNWQLLAYLTGILELLNLNDKETMVELVVVQPRAFHPDGPVRRHIVRADKLRAQVNEAWQKAARAYPTPDHGDAGPPAEATTGPHCKECPARGVCKALQAETSRIVEYVARAEKIAQDETSVGTELSILENARDLLKGRVSALEAQAESFLRAGKIVPNYCLKPGQSHLKWEEGVTAADVDALGTVIGKSMRKPIKEDINSRTSTTVTPTQAIAAGVDAVVIGAYASRPAAGLKLARSNITDVVKAFGPIKS